MLSSSTNTGDEHFVVNHHLTLITQPVLAVRSRPKKIPSALNQNERTTSKPNGNYFPQSDSSDSGIDLCLSSSSSIQYGQQHSIVHRPLSALNEDSLTPDQNEYFSKENLLLTKPTKRTNFIRTDSIEDLISPRKTDEKHRSSSFAASEPTQLDHLIQRTTNENPFLMKKTSANSTLKTRKPIECSTTTTTTTTSSSDEMTPRSKLPNVQRQKPKAITPLGHYPNPEQIRAHINRSVIDTQHPPQFSLSKRKGILQQLIPFDASPSKINNRYVRYHVENHFPTTQFHAETNGEFQRQEIKRTKVSNPPVRDFVQMNKTKLQSSQKETHRIVRKPFDESDLSDEEQNRQKFQKNLFTNVPQRHQRTTNESNRIGFARFNIDVPPVIQSHRTSRLPQLNDEQKSTTNHRVRQKTRTIESNSSTETNTNVFLPNRPSKFVENLIRRPVNVPMKHRPKGENQFLNVSKVGQNRFPQPTRTQRVLIVKSRESSPTSWSVISQHQSNQERIDFHDSSSSSSHISFHFDSGRTSRRTLIDGRFVRPDENPKKSLFVDSPTQTASHHTYPFTCTAEFETLIENSLNEKENIEQKDLTTENLHLLSGKLTISMHPDDLSTNYDSDDGWSNASADVLYTDERHLASKKNHRITSSQLTLKVDEKKLK